MCRFFMTKYNKLFKQQVIEFYPQNGKNRSLTHRQFQLKDTTLCRWISKYNHNGINELERYNRQIKTTCIKQETQVVISILY